MYVNLLNSKVFFSPKKKNYSKNNRNLFYIAFVVGLIEHQAEDKKILCA